MENRSGEQPRLRFRGKRVHRSNGKWYFHTREGISVGPYQTIFEAEVEASILANLLKDTCASEEKAVILAFVYDSFKQTYDASQFDKNDDVQFDEIAN